MNDNNKVLSFANTVYPVFLILFWFYLLIPLPGHGKTGDIQSYRFPCAPLKRHSKPQKKDVYFQAQLASFGKYMSEKYQFNQANLACVLSHIKPKKRVIELVRPAPRSQPRNWQAYKAPFTDPARISGGLDFWNQYETALTRAEAQFGVPAHIIVAIIGVETFYGKHTGNFRVLDTLATLAFKYPEAHNKAARMAFFREELENALLLAYESDIDPLSLYGSYAGAIGWAQFMPSSLRKYAISYNGKGKIDLRKSPVDAIGSIANYLVAHGWERGDDIVFPVSIAPDCSVSPEKFLNQGLAAKFSMDELKTACISQKTEIPHNKTFGLIDLENGTLETEYWLGTNNFFAITYYNRSYFYAMSVVALANAIKTQRYPSSF